MMDAFYFDEKCPYSILVIIDYGNGSGKKRRVGLLI